MLPKAKTNVSIGMSRYQLLASEAFGVTERLNAPILNDGTLSRVMPFMYAANSEKFALIVGIISRSVMTRSAPVRLMNIS